MRVAAPALVLRGEAGVGKTALLRYLAGRRRMSVDRAIAGVEAEMELAFAGMHQLCAPMLDRLERASGAAAAGSAGRARPGDGETSRPVPHLAGDAQPAVGRRRGASAAVPGGRRAVAGRASAQILTFVARRLVAESVAIVFAVREPVSAAFRGPAGAGGQGLDNGVAHALLSSAVPSRLDERVRDRIIAETRGNPLALLELPRGLTATELAGGFGFRAQRPLGADQESFARRLEALPERRAAVCC